MGRKVSVTFDEHDLEQLELLARLNKIRTPTLVRRICQAHLDRGKVNLRREHVENHDDDD